MHVLNRPNASRVLKFVNKTTALLSQVHSDIMYTVSDRVNDMYSVLDPNDEELQAERDNIKYVFEQFREINDRVQVLLHMLAVVKRNLEE